MKPDEQVLFFPTLGARTPDGASWELQIHGWVSEPSDARRARHRAATLGDAVGTLQITTAGLRIRV
ncbi:MAG: hypothetical protein IH986_01990 [Planctomycetes bacterium]|nr:hypothetical protein [Planctomycetota bacterium]